MNVHLFFIYVFCSSFIPFKNLKLTYSRANRQHLKPMEISFTFCSELM